MCWNTICRQVEVLPLDSLWDCGAESLIVFTVDSDVDLVRLSDFPVTCSVNFLCRFLARYTVFILKCVDSTGRSYFLIHFHFL